jgi:hypothetical protein
MKMAVFWVVAPCNLVNIYRRFRGACCLNHEGDHYYLDDGGIVKISMEYGTIFKIFSSHSMLQYIKCAVDTELLKSNVHKICFNFVLEHVTLLCVCTRRLFIISTTEQEKVFKQRVTISVYTTVCSFLSNSHMFRSPS